jgi:hypothetical protein
MASKLCFVDWDDTLLCSSWIVRMKELFASDFSLLKPSFTLLEEAVCKFLDIIYKFGYRMYIITNSETGWVELSAGKYIPLILNKIEEYSIPIISARTQYEQLHGRVSIEESISFWKKDAFKNILHSFCLPKSSSGSETIYDLCGHIPNDPIGFIFDPVSAPPPVIKVNLLVIGDSHLDVQAAESATLDPSVKVKLLKGVEHPDLFTLVYQLRHMTDIFESFITETKSANVDPNLTIPSIPNSNSKLQTIFIKCDDNKENEKIVVF